MLYTTLYVSGPLDTEHERELNSSPAKGLSSSLSAEGLSDGCIFTPGFKSQVDLWKSAAGTSYILSQGHVLGPRLVYFMICVSQGSQWSLNPTNKIQHPKT